MAGFARRAPFWRARRGVLALLVALPAGLLLAAPAADDLCREPLDVRPRVEALARPAAPAAVAAGPSGPAALLGNVKAQAGALAAGAVLVLKMQDWLAEPTHVTLAAGLERLDCAHGATRLQ